MNSLLWRIYAVVVLVGMIVFSFWVVQDWRGKKHLAQEQAHLALQQTAQLLVTELPESQEKDKLLLQKTLLNDLRWKVIFISSTQYGTEFYWGPPPAPRKPTSTTDVYVPLPSWKPNYLTQVEASVPLPNTPYSQQLTGIRQFFGNSDLFDTLRALAVFLTALTLVTGIFLLFASSQASTPPKENLTPDFPQEPVQSTRQSSQSWDLDYDFPDLDLEDAESPETELELGPIENLPPLELVTPASKATQEDWSELTLEDLETPAPLAEPHQPNLKARLKELSQVEPNQELSVIAFARLPLGNPKDTARKLFEAVGSQEGFETPSFYAVLLPGVGLEEALQKAKVASQILPGVVAGVSALAGRSTLPETLISEAERALQRAVETARPALGYKILTEHTWV